MPGEQMLFLSFPPSKKKKAKERIKNGGPFFYFPSLKHVSSFGSSRNPHFFFAGIQAFDTSDPSLPLFANLS